MTTFLFNFLAKFKISIEDFGLEKSMITSVSLKASKLLFCILTPLIFFSYFMSVKLMSFKFLFFDIWLINI